MASLLASASPQLFPYGGRRNTYGQGSQFRRYLKDSSGYKRNPRYQILPTTTKTTTTTTQRSRVSKSENLDYSQRCGIRFSAYRPDQKIRRGRIIIPSSDTAGAISAPSGSFPWLASLFLRRKSGEAYFMCAATILTPKVLVSASHCFNKKWPDNNWYVRVGDNYIAEDDPDEQTFQVDLVVRHAQFLPLSRPGGDGRNDIALLKIRPRNSRYIQFSSYVAPACLPSQGTSLLNYRRGHCEISGWGMMEYNNTASYPDSVRAAAIQVGAVTASRCNRLYGRDVQKTGKFCAGGRVDACQEDSGGPLMCQMGGRYHLVGIVSSGKGCGIYPGLYTEVARYTDWILQSLIDLENEVL